MFINELIIIVLFLIGLYILIGVNEFGHYFMTKLFGFKVHAVQIGLGKKFFQTMIGETKFSLGYFFVAGKTICDENVVYASTLKQQLITFAGPLVSIVFGVILLYFVFYNQTWLLLNPLYY